MQTVIILIKSSDSHKSHVRFMSTAWMIRHRRGVWENNLFMHLKNYIIKKTDRPAHLCLPGIGRQKKQQKKNKTNADTQSLFLTVYSTVSVIFQVLEQFTQFQLVACHISLHTLCAHILMHVCVCVFLNTHRRILGVAFDVQLSPLCIIASDRVVTLLRLTWYWPVSSKHLWRQKPPAFLSLCLSVLTRAWDLSQFLQHKQVSQQLEFSAYK